MKSIGYFYGRECFIADTYKTRVKTHKNKIIDWFYEKIYRYEKKSYLENVTNGDVVALGDSLIFKDKKTYEELTRQKDFINYVKNQTVRE